MGTDHGFPLLKFTPAFCAALLFSDLLHFPRGQHSLSKETIVGRHKLVSTAKNRGLSSCQRAGALRQDSLG